MPESGQSEKQEKGAPSWSLSWMKGAQALGPPSTVFPRRLAGSWMRSEATGLELSFPKLEMAHYPSNKKEKYEQVNTMAQWVKTRLGMCTSHVIMSCSNPNSPGSPVQLPVNALGRRWSVTQGLGFLCPVWDTWEKFVVLGFSMTLLLLS